MYTVQFTFSFFSIYKCFLCLLSNLAFVRTSFFTCPQCLFYLIASLSAARVPVMHRASTSSEEKQDKWHLALLISGQPPVATYVNISRYLKTLSLPEDQYTARCVTMSGTSWSPWHRIDWGHTPALPSNQRLEMISEDQSDGAANHLPESPAVSELPWWLLPIVTSANIWCYVPTEMCISNWDRLYLISLSL